MRFIFELHHTEADTVHGVVLPTPSARRTNATVRKLSQLVATLRVHSKPIELADAIIRFRPSGDQRPSF
jgi:hypothetical protein